MELPTSQPHLSVEEDNGAGHHGSNAKAYGREGCVMG